MIPEIAAMKRPLSDLDIFVYSTIGCGHLALIIFLVAEFLRWNGVIRVP